MSWAVYEEANGERHVLPEHDLRDHIRSADCWCGPARDEEDDAILVHHSMDKRELIESGEAMKQ